MTDPRSFSEAFAPLAHHLFPDGCPETELEAIWPSRVDRRPIPPQQARTALSNLRATSVLEMEAVIAVACRTLPQSHRVGSPLVDGTSQHFCSLLRSLVPDDSLSDRIVGRLVSILSSSSLLDTKGRCRVLQFLTLAARRFPEARRRITVYYAVVFHWALKPPTCADAVRLLLTITRQTHVKRYRWQQLQAAQASFSSLSSLSLSSLSLSSSLSSLQQPLKSLQNLFADYDASIPTTTTETAWFPFPDAAWAREFGEGAPSATTASDDLLTSLQYHSHHLPYILYEQWYERPPAHKLQVVQALAAICIKTSVLPPQAEAFVFQDILRSAGAAGQSSSYSSSNAMIQLVCFDILPALTPRSFRRLRSQVLVPLLEQLFLYGDSTVQYAIVAGALANLVHRWSTSSSSSSSSLDDGNDTAAADQNNNKKTLCKQQLQLLLIQWTDDLLLRGFLLGDGHDEVLRVAAVDFYSAVDDALPSAGLTYRLLLSKSAVSMDRVCHLLLVRNQNNNKPVGLEETQSSSSSSDRVQLFHCMVQEFCSVLWRGSTDDDDDDDDETEQHRSSILYTDLRPAVQSKLLQSQYSSSKGLSITHSAVFCAFARDYSSTAGQILEEIDKVHYLDYLRERGFHGLHAFLSTFALSAPAHY
jgi:hypothetical protein